MNAAAAYFAAIGEGDPRHRTPPTTMAFANQVRLWAERSLAVRVRIVIEREGGRNRVLLRREDGAECEVCEVRQLHRNRARLGPGVVGTLLLAAFSGQKRPSYGIARGDVGPRVRH